MCGWFDTALSIKQLVPNQRVETTRRWLVSTTQKPVVHFKAEPLSHPRVLRQSAIDTWSVC